VATTFEEVLADMKQRDYDDTHRATAPLKAAADAVLVDTSGNTLEQSVAALKQVVLDKLEGTV
jgi:cytidylate kinase